MALPDAVPACGEAAVFFQTSSSCFGIYVTHYKQGESGDWQEMDAAARANDPPERIERCERPLQPIVMRPAAFC